MDTTQYIRSIRGPVTLIAVGVLFLLDHRAGYSFHQTWPVLLILYGLLTLFGRESRPPQQPPAPGAPPARPV
jgi:hypothetical protein